MSQELCQVHLRQPKTIDIDANLALIDICVTPDPGGYIIVEVGQLRQWAVEYGFVDWVEEMIQSFDIEIDDDDSITVFIDQ